jgi:hypothetical protein
MQDLRTIIALSNYLKKLELIQRTCQVDKLPPLWNADASIALLTTRASKISFKFRVSLSKVLKHGIECIKKRSITPKQYK